MWTTLNRTRYEGELLTWGDFTASEEHEVFYTPPTKSTKRWISWPWENLVNLKVLVESIKASIHLKINFFFHATIAEQLWLVYFANSM